MIEVNILAKEKRVSDTINAGVDKIRENANKGLGVAYVDVYSQSSDECSLIIEEIEQATGWFGPNRKNAFCGIVDDMRYYNCRFCSPC